MKGTECVQCSSLLLIQVSSELSLPEYLNHAVAFANAYLMAHHDNALAVILAHQLGRYVFSVSTQTSTCT